MSPRPEIRMKRIVIALGALAGAVLLAPAHAQPLGGNPAAGEQKSAACVACHGSDGNSSDFPAYPRLAGQYEDYLYKSLRQYRDGTRVNAIMAGMVAPLSDQDMRDLAAYYASLPGKLHVLPRR
jgi:cytochrome c553